MTDTAALLTLDDIWHERGDRELFGGLELRLEAGQLTQVLGPNGHGKSTLLRILAGFIIPDAGALKWRGGPWAGRHDEHPAPIGYLGECSGWSGAESVEENWRYHQALSGLRAPTVLDGIPDSWLSRRYGDLSTGQRKRVALTGLAQRQAKLWLLDEPLSGLDVAAVATWCQRLRSAADAGIAVVVVSHEPIGDIVDQSFEWSV